MYTVLGEEIVERFLKIQLHTPVLIVYVVTLSDYVLS